MPRPTLFLACLVLLGSTAAAVVPASQPAAGGPTEFPSFGVAFALPPGWAEIPREKAGRVGQWIGPDSKPTAIKSLVMIETGRPGATTAATLAQNLARNFGGAVMDDPTTLGGEPALVVRADNHDDEVAPVIGLVCLHGDNVYLVMGGAVKGRDVRPEVEAIRKSWKWTPVEQPSKHLAFRDQPFPAFDGRVTLNVPRMMHAVAPDDPRTQLDLALFNLARNNADFRASMTLETLKPGETFDQAKDRFLAELVTQNKFHKPPEWQERKGATPRLMTATVEADRPQPADTDTLHHQWAVVSLGEASGKIVLIHVTHEAETEEERHRYELAVERIVDSVAVVAAK
jgi:hypothetical protein